MSADGDTVRFTPSSQAPIHVLVARIETAMTYPHGHPGVPGIPEGEGCPRCNAEKALAAALARLEAAEADRGRLALEAATADQDWKRAEAQRDALAEALRWIKRQPDSSIQGSYETLTAIKRTARAALAEAGLE